MSTRTSNRSLRRKAALLLSVFAASAAMATTLAACGDDDGVRTDAGSGAPTGPSGGTDVAVQVLVAGGFTTPDAAASTVPLVTVLRDGTVLTPAAVPAIYPGPAITPLQRVSVSTERVDALLDVADELGLLRDEVDFGEPPVADAPDTTVTIVSDGVKYTHTARALGFEAEGPDDGLTDEQRANRDALRDFIAATDELPPGEEQYVPAAVIVTVIGPYQPDDIPQEPQPWPLATLPELGGNFPCTEISGAEAAELLAALKDANQRTPWVIDGEEHALAFRPAVPGHRGCDQ